MKIAMSQMSMTDNVSQNLNKCMNFCDSAKNCDLLFFPEIQLSPFFPQYHNLNVDNYCLTKNSYEVNCFLEKAKKYNYYISPNIYLKDNEKRYDASLWIDKNGQLVDYSKMVHIAQVEQFYEQDYYYPYESGFKVFDTEFGKISIVICYDRHLPESIRTCTIMGADLIIIPTANTKAEPLEMFEWEIRVQAMQNQVFIAMCNRVGKEGDMSFAGESLLVAPTGDVLFKADDKEQFITFDIDLSESKILQSKIPYLKTRRKEFYK